MGNVIYGHIENTGDIGRINRRIRSEIRSARTKPRITELKRRSRYLITLMSSPNFRKRYNIAALRKRSKREYRLTTKAANKRLSAVCKSCKSYTV